MNFETEYKNIKFHIIIDMARMKDVSKHFGNKFNKLTNQTILDLKKGIIIPYNIMITSHQNDEERTHYWSNVLLTANADTLVEELGHYLDDEEILDSIVVNWELAGDELGPGWKLGLK